MLFVSGMEDIRVKYARHRKANAAWVHLSKNNNFEAESKKWLGIWEKGSWGEGRCWSECKMACLFLIEAITWSAVHHNGDT